MDENADENTDENAVENTMETRRWSIESDRPKSGRMLLAKRRIRNL